MALPAGAVIEVRLTGNDANGGGFNAARGGTDYTLQDAAQATGTVTSASTTVTATTGIFTAAMVGNYITDGTTWKEITAYTNATTVTVDSAPSWTAASIKVGGAIKSPGLAAGVSVNGNTIYIKYNATPYSISSSTPLVANGTMVFGSTTTTRSVVGYDTTRSKDNVDANFPTLQASGISSTAIVSMVAASSQQNMLRNLIVDGNSLSTITGFTVFTTRGVYHRLRALNCTTGFNGPFYSRCLANNCTTGFATANALFACAAIGGSIGFSLAIAGSLDVCVASGCSSQGFLGTTFSSYLDNCTAFNCGDGLKNTADRGVFSNFVAYGCSGYGLNVDTTCLLIACAAGNNTSGNLNLTPLQIPTLLTLSGDPFANSGGTITTLEDVWTNFAPNNTAGAGAVLRGAGYP